MRSQPLSSSASRRRAEEQFKTKKKLIPPTLPHSSPRWRKPRACARFGWPRKQPTRRLQIATRRQRRPLDLRRADTFRGDLRPHVGQNPSKGSCGAQLQNAQSAYQRAVLLLDAVADRRGQAFTQDWKPKATTERGARSERSAAPSTLQSKPASHSEFIQPDLKDVIVRRHPWECSLSYNSTPSINSPKVFQCSETML
jgi:hypothetical protein